LLVQSGQGCDRLRAIAAKAGPLGELLEPDLRGTAVKHISHCGTCRPRQDQQMLRYAPALVPLLYGADLRHRVMHEIGVAGGAGYAWSHAPDRRNSPAAADSCGGPPQPGTASMSAGAASPPVTEAGGILAPAGGLVAQGLRRPVAFMANRFEQLRAACYVRLTSLVNFTQASPWTRVIAVGTAAAVTGGVTAAVVLSGGQPPSAHAASSPAQAALPTPSPQAGSPALLSPAQPVQPGAPALPPATTLLNGTPTARPTPSASVSISQG
jgi:hypothetical protein